ncbi:hypothetical protein N7478_006861 [Penicillium angulare]|uniref:uncharacterized protein n=1 Tax=Penicillium angulare TaxID=116970 RepID=UPI0025401BBE|nr:uncharacterized protein N7478_006861 [Penicillium angulare]KAJ5281489.1 hypothetical protein N7478_006861 [Penicillium angulare]
MCNYFKNYYIYSRCSNPSAHVIKTSLDNDGAKSKECSSSPHDRFIVVAGNCILCDPTGGGDLPDESDEEINAILARDYSKPHMRTSAPEERPLPSATSRMTSSHDDSGYASRATRSAESKTRISGLSRLNDTGAKEKYASETSNRARLKERQYETDDRSDRDAESVYTAGPDIHPQRREAYIVVFADELLSRALPEEIDEDLIGSLCAALPKLLKIFATMVGAADTKQIHRELMVFIRKHR